MGPALGASGAITIVAGVTLAPRLKWGHLDKWFSDGWGYAILIGFIVAIAAMATGGATGALANKMSGLGQSIQGRPPSPEEAQQMQHMAARLRTLGRATAVLVLIGVGSMAAARFV